MKKIIIILIIPLLIGCTHKKNIDYFIPTDNQKINYAQKDEYQDDNPIIVGLYQKGKLVETFNTTFTNQKDIATFNIVFTNEKDLKSTNLKNNWNKYYQKYENIDKYKIGFLIEMEANGKKLENLVLDPSSQHKLDPYLYVYLYDGIHQKDGAKYTHLSPKDIKDNTIYSSIKLYLHHDTNKITSPIKLTVFTYKDENDFINNHYRGNSKYTITINKK